MSELWQRYGACRPIEEMTREEVRAFAKELGEAIARHPYNCGQVIWMEEYDQLEDMEHLYELCGEREQVLDHNEHCE